MVSVPKTPANSSPRLHGGGAQGELLVDGQVGAVVDGRCRSSVVLRGKDRVPAGRCGRRCRCRRPRTRRRCRPARGRAPTSAAGWPAAARCSWALSQTATTRSSSLDDVGDVGGAGGVEARPWRRATATARGWTRSAGLVPAEAAGCGCAAPTARRRVGSGRSCGCRRTPPAARPRHRAERDGGQGLRAPGAGRCGGGRPRTGTGRPGRVLQHLEVVGDQVGRHAQRLADLAGRGVAEDQRVDDRQPRRIAQCGVHPGPRLQRHSVSVH